MSTRDQNNNADTHDDVVSSLYDNTRTDLPPENVDDHILAAARRSVGVKPRPRSVAPFSGRWTVPLSIAAVLVLTISFFFEVDLIDQAGQMGEIESDAIEMHGPDTDSPASADDVASPQRLRQQKAGPGARAKRSRALEKKAAPMAMQNEKASPDRSLLADSAAPKKRLSARQEIGMVEESLGQQRVIKEDLAKQSPSNQIQVDTRGAKSQTQVLSQNPAQVTAAANSTAGTSAPAAVASTLFHDQQKWLGDIELLIKQNKTDDAIKQFKEFRKQYPDYAIDKLEKRFGKAFVVSATELKD